MESGVDLKIFEYDSDYESIIESFYQHIRQWLVQKIPDSALCKNPSSQFWEEFGCNIMENQNEFAVMS